MKYGWVWTRHNCWIAWKSEHSGAHYYSGVHRARTDRTGSGCPRSSKRVYLKVGVCALCHNWNAVSVSGLSLNFLKLELARLKSRFRSWRETDDMCSIESLLCGIIAGLISSRTMPGAGCLVGTAFSPTRLCLLRFPAPPESSRCSVMVRAWP